MIEHLLDPGPLFEFIERSLKPSGILILSTPNQVHLINRVKCLFGLNTWEDFSYWLSSGPFYGHVRELTPHEISLLPFRNMAFSTLKYNSWPLNRLNPLLHMLLKPIFLIPGFGLHMFAIYQKF